MINAAEQVSTDYTMDTLIQYADYKIDGPVANKRAKALEAVREKVRERSGNPAVRAGAQEASEEAVEKAASKSKIGQEAEAASGVAKVAKRGVRLLGKGIGALWSFGEAYTSDTPVKTAAEGLIASAVAASFAAPWLSPYLGSRLLPHRSSRGRWLRGECLLPTKNSCRSTCNSELRKALRICYRPIGPTVGRSGRAADRTHAIGE